MILIGCLIHVTLTNRIIEYLVKSIEIIELTYKKQITSEYFIQLKTTSTQN